MLRTLMIATLATLLTACSGVKVTDYRDLRPALDIEQFFNGELTAHGVVKDRGGKVIRTFNADISAHWRDGVGGQMATATTPALRATWLETLGCNKRATACFWIMFCVCPTEEMRLMSGSTIACTSYRPIS